MTISADDARAIIAGASSTVERIDDGYWNELVEDLDREARHLANSEQRLAATVIELQARIDKVLALHYVVMDNPRGGPVRECCIECDTDYPCPTVLALTQGGEQ